MPDDNTQNTREEESFDLRGTQKPAKDTTETSMEAPTETSAETPQEMPAEDLQTGGISVKPAETSTEEPIAEPPTAPVAETPTEPPTAPVAETPTEPPIAPIAETPTEPPIAPVAEIPTEPPELTPDMSTQFAEPTETAEGANRKKIIMIAGAIAAVLALGFIGYKLFFGGEETPADDMNETDQSTETEVEADTENTIPAEEELPPGLSFDTEETDVAPEEELSELDAIVEELEKTYSNNEPFENEPVDNEPFENEPPTKIAR